MKRGTLAIGLAACAPVALPGCDAILGAEVFSGAPDASSEATVRDAARESEREASGDGDARDGSPDTTYDGADAAAREATAPSCADPPCSVGEPCARASDCASSYCYDSECAYAASCSALYLRDSYLASGAYTIQTSGTPFSVYCDMTDQGGGWTLVAKMGSNASPGAFDYSATYWTTPTTLEPLSADTSQVEAKFESFNSVPFENVLAMMVARASSAAPNMLLVPLSDATSFLHMMSLSPGPTTNLGMSAWLNLTQPAAVLQSACNAEGVNQVPTGDQSTAHIRLGLIANNASGASDCSSPDSYVGFGGEYTSGSCTAVSYSAGAMEGAGCGGGTMNIADFGYLFVR